MRGLVVAVALCVLAEPAAAHDLHMQFTRLGSAEGISQGAVTSIVQDSQGLLWLGSEDGLTRYDGYEVDHIYRDRNASNGLPNNWISSMVVDRTGRLWIGTDGGGVVWYDAESGHFHTPLSRDGQPLLSPAARVRQLFVDRKGRVWAATRSSGVYVLELDAGRAQQFRYDPANEGSLSSDSVFRIAEGPDGTIWLGTLAGLDRLDAVGGRIEHFGPRLQELAGQKGSPQINALHVDQRGLLWAGTNSGLLRLETSSGAMELMRHEPGVDGSLPDDHVTAILEDDERRLWVGTSAGLGLLDRRTGHISVLHSNRADSLSLPDDNVMTLYQDRGGLLWVGTKFAGAASWNPRSWSFGHNQLGFGDSDNVTAFAEDRTGVLWVGTFGNGLHALNRETGAARSYRHDPGQPKSIGDDNVMAIVVDGQDRIWYGTMSAGVERLDPRTGQIDRFPSDPRDPGSLSAPGIMSMLCDSKGQIWVGTYGGGLNRIDPETGAVHRYPLASDGGLSSDRATALWEDSTGLIWIGTDGGGLNVLDQVSGHFRHYMHDEANPRSLSANIVYAVQEDARGHMWIGTRGGGLDRVIGSPVSQEGLTFQNYSESDGLPNSTVYGIESDQAGLLWLSTNRGLSRFDPEEGTFRNYRRSHGLQSDEFNFGAHYRSPSGELFFGGARGFNAFFAERLQVNERSPQVVLTAMLKLDKPIDVYGALHDETPIRLRYSDDMVTFRFAALDFAEPAANRYAYKLEGFDRDWIQADNTRQATYTNLQGGDYVFRVRASNSDGKWNEQGVAVALNVEPPPWLRWWALAGYAACFALMLYAVWAAQQRKVLREAAYARRLADEVDQRTAELAERNQQLQDVNHQLREASVTDALTGVGNRRSLREVITRLLETAKSDRAKTYDTARLVLMVIDLDRLKPVNDEFGHEAGDKVLQQVAEILTSLCRGTDHVSRWGGDEFVVMCRDADLAAASVLAERIRATVAEQIFRIGEGVAARTSCSIGFAALPFVADAPDKLGWEQTLALADLALYQAKRQRNMWVGWAGTARAAGLDNILQSIEADGESLERDGFIEVRRRPSVADGDTIDRLLSGGATSRDR